MRIAAGGLDVSQSDIHVVEKNHPDRFSIVVYSVACLDDTLDEKSTLEFDDVTGNWVTVEKRVDAVSAKIKPPLRPEPLWWPRPQNPIEIAVVSLFMVHILVD